MWLLKVLKGKKADCNNDKDIINSNGTAVGKDSANEMQIAKEAAEINIKNKFYHGT